MKKWGIGTLVVGIGLAWLVLPATDFEATEQVVYGESGRWAAPAISALCGDTQRCAEWHDETDGTNGPQTLCCVEESKLSSNSFRDCVIRFAYGPRDGE